MPELPRSSPGFEDLDAPESEGELLNGTESDLKDETLVGYAVDLVSLGYGVPPTIQEQLSVHLTAGDDLAEAVGKIRLDPRHFPSTAMEEWGGYTNSEDMARGYLYRESRQSASGSNGRRSLP